MQILTVLTRLPEGIGVGRDSPEREGTGCGGGPPGDAGSTRVDSTENTRRRVFLATAQARQAAQLARQETWGDGACGGSCSLPASLQLALRKNDQLSPAPYEQGLDRTCTSGNLGWFSDWIFNIQGMHHKLLCILHGSFQFE